MTTKLTDKQEAVLAFASQHGTIDFYQASELGANGSTLASMTKKGWLAKQECNGLNDWIATDAGKALLPVQRVSTKLALAGSVASAILKLRQPSR